MQGSRTPIAAFPDPASVSRLFQLRIKWLVGDRKRAPNNPTIRISASSLTSTSLSSTVALQGHDFLGLSRYFIRISYFSSQATSNHFTFTRKKNLKPTPYIMKALAVFSVLAVLAANVSALTVNTPYVTYSNVMTAMS